MRLGVITSAQQLGQHPLVEQFGTHLAEAASVLAYQVVTAPVVVIDLAASRTAACLQTGIAQAALQQPCEREIAARLAAHVGRFAFFQHFLHLFKVLFTHQSAVAFHPNPVLGRVRCTLVGAVEYGPARIHLVLEDVGQQCSCRTTARAMSGPWRLGGVLWFLVPQPCSAIAKICRTVLASVGCWPKRLRLPSATIT